MEGNPRSWPLSMSDTPENPERPMAASDATEARGVVDKVAERNHQLLDGLTPEQLREARTGRGYRSVLEGGSHKAGRRTHSGDYLTHLTPSTSLRDRLWADKVKKQTDEPPLTVEEVVKRLEELKFVKRLDVGGYEANLTFTDQPRLEVKLQQYEIPIVSGFEKGEKRFRRADLAKALQDHPQGFDALVFPHAREFTPEEVVNRLLQKTTLRVHQLGQRALSIRSRGMEDVMFIELGVKKTGEEVDGCPVIMEDALLTELRKLKGSERFNTLAHKKILPIGAIVALKEGNIDRLIEQEYLKLEPELSTPKLLSIKEPKPKNGATSKEPLKDALTELGVEVNYKAGHKGLRERVVRDDRLKEALARNPKALNALVVDEVQLDVRDVLSGLAREGLLYKLQTNGKGTQVCVRTDEARDLLRSCGVEVHDNREMTVNDKILLAAGFKGDVGNKSLFTSRLITEEKRRQDDPMSRWKM